MFPWCSWRGRAKYAEARKWRRSKNFMERKSRLRCQSHLTLHEKSFWSDLSLSDGEVGKKEKVGGLKDCERHYPGWPFEVLHRLLKNVVVMEANYGFPWQPEVDMGFNSWPACLNGESRVGLSFAMKIATLHVAACSIFIPPQPFPRLFLAGAYESDKVSKKYKSNFRCL